MEQIVLVVHLLISLAIIGLIMMQRGKGSDIGASFGAGASQTLFGSAGNTNVLTKATAWLVVAFFATSFGLAFIADNKTADVEDLGFDLPVETVQELPADATLNEELPEIGEIPSVSAQAGEAESDLPVVDSIASDEGEASSPVDE